MIRPKVRSSGFKVVGYLCLDVGPFFACSWFCDILPISWCDQCHNSLCDLHGPCKLNGTVKIPKEHLALGFIIWSKFSKKLRHLLLKISKHLYSLSLRNVWRWSLSISFWQTFKRTRWGHWTLSFRNVHQAWNRCCKKQDPPDILHGCASYLTINI